MSGHLFEVEKGRETRKGSSVVLLACNPLSSFFAGFSENWVIKSQGTPLVGEEETRKEKEGGWDGLVGREARRSKPQVSNTPPRPFLFHPSSHPLPSLHCHERTNGMSHKMQGREEKRRKQGVWVVIFFVPFRLSPLLLFPSLFFFLPVDEIVLKSYVGRRASAFEKKGIGGKGGKEERGRKVPTPTNSFLLFLPPQKKENEKERNIFLEGVGCERRQARQAERDK